LEEHTVEHGENEPLLGFGRRLKRFELALELGCAPALTGRLVGARAGDAKQHAGRHVEEVRETW
jgi:hypothetical protein